MFLTLHLKGWLSLHRLALFLELWYTLSFGPYFFVTEHLLHFKEQSLKYSPGRGNLCGLLWHCLWGRDPRGNNATSLALTPLSKTPSTTHKQIGPFWCWFLGGWVCVHFRTLWVSPTNSPVRLGVSPTVATPHRILQSECLRLYFSSFSLPSCSSHFICTQMWNNLICQPPTRRPQPTSCCLATWFSLPHRLGLSLPLLPVWMNVSSLTP